MGISNWPVQERPRERLVSQGASALSDAELLAIFFRTGIAGQSALELARCCLANFGSLAGVMQANLEEFESYKGLGLAKWAGLQAAQELAQRAAQEPLRRQALFERPDDVQEFLRQTLRLETREVFLVLFLNSSHHLIKSEVLFKGTLNQTAVYPREVVKRALLHHSSAVILAHNHPSGVCEPSAADEILTIQIQKALATVNIRVLDHVIVAGPECLSFAKTNRIAL